MPVVLSLFVSLAISLCHFDIFSFLEDADVDIVMLFISNCHLASREHAACGLGVRPKLPSFLVELEPEERCRGGHCPALHPDTLSETHRPFPGQVRFTSPYILLERGYALKCSLVPSCWGSPYPHMIQPILCLPLSRQEPGEREKEASSTGCGEGLEAAGSLRQRWRQEHATVFGVEPEECGLGRRDVLGFMLYKHLMRHLVGIYVSQRRVRVCELVFKYSVVFQSISVLQLFII